MNVKIASIAGCFLLAGCTAQMVSPVGSSTSSAYAPVNEAQRSGLIKYLNAGADSVIKQRRDDAYKQMFSACDGRYKIDAEGPRAEGGVVIVEPGIRRGSAIASSQSTEYWYIQFSCVR